jgi:hypothetical protein
VDEKDCRDEMFVNKRQPKSESISIDFETYQDLEDHALVELKLVVQYQGRIWRKGEEVVT